jgi:hypothetical protein
MEERPLRKWEVAGSNPAVGSIMLTAHQPQYLPYMGFFNKVMLADKFVFLDHVQFRKNGWQNRNRIRTKHGWIWLTIPILTKGKFSQRIYYVKINNSVNWRSKHWKSIYYNYQHAPYFSEYKDFFESVYSTNWETLWDLNIFTTMFLFDALNIKVQMFSSSSFTFVGKKTDLLIEMCLKLGADTYLSGCGPGAKTYVDLEKFMQNSLRHKFQYFTSPTYVQQYDSFVPNLSVIDLLFNYGKEKSREIIRHSGDIGNG